MAWRVIKQADGKLAIWSTVNDALVVTDATEEEVVGEFVTAAIKKAEADAREEIARAVTLEEARG